MLEATHAQAQQAVKEAQESAAQLEQQSKQKAECDAYYDQKVEVGVVRVCDLGGDGGEEADLRPRGGGGGGARGGGGRAGAAGERGGADGEGVRAGGGEGGSGAGADRAGRAGVPLW